MRSLKVSGIIHLFAVLHAAVALLCRVAGVHDELVLTLLTIVMIVLICLLFLVIIILIVVLIRKLVRKAKKKSM